MYKRVPAVIGASQQSDDVTPICLCYSLSTHMLQVADKGALSKFMQLQNPSSE